MKLFNQFFRAFTVLSLAGLLAACAPTIKIPDEAGVYSRAGRFALNVLDKTSNRNKDSVQGGFVWLDSNERLTLDLRNPLGSTLARVLVTQDSAVLTHANGEQLVASDPDALVAEVLGNAIPVNGLRYWLKGQVAPGPVGSLKRDARQNLVSFTQSGWQVNLSDYDSKGPRRLGMQRNETQEAITVRLVISEE